MKKIILLSTVLLLSVVIIYSSQSSLLFLSMPVGAPASALGGAYTARAEGVYGMYWNPASLNNSEKDNEVIFFHNNYIEDLKHTYIGYTRNVPELYGTFGISINMFDHGSFNRTTFHQNHIPGDYDSSGGTFGSNDYAIGLSYNPETKHPVKFGVSMNILKSKIDNADATGFALDLGWLYDNKILDVPYRVGITVKNIGGKIKYDLQKEELPLTFKTGFALDYDINEQFILSPLFDIIRDQQMKETYLMLGTELVYDKMFAFRLGYDGMKDAGNNLTFGCGVEYMDFSFNYAWKDYGDLSSTHIFELLYKF
jgi:hypothetical protein